MARHSIELGWMNLPPCTKVDWVDSSIPGVRVPRIVTAEQRLTAYLEIETDGMRDNALGAVRECALAAVATAGGLGAITSNPASALAAFKPAFLACFGARFADIAIQNVSLHTNTACLW